MFQCALARFANVAFSNGSLLYGFMERLLQRQPISCPSDVKRFFVSPEESGEICLLTCILGKSGDIYFPKLDSNQLVSFKKITIDFFKYLEREIKLFDSEDEAKKASLSISDLSPYPVYFFNSDTSGEKLYEEFYSNNDVVDLDKYESIGIVMNSAKPTNSAIESIINELELIFNNEMYKKSDRIKIMNKLIPDFKHIEKGKNLDERM